MSVSLDKLLKGVMSVVQRQERSLGEVSSELQVTRRDVEATRMDVEVIWRDLQSTRREFETHLAAVRIRTRRELRDQRLCGETAQYWQIDALDNVSPIVSGRDWTH
jgi:hypothetical protein